MPILGLGTWQIHGKKAEKSVLCALDAGYRHIDTAAAYNNEEAAGRAIRKSGIPREEVFITTKLWNEDHGYKPAISACDRSLEKLGFSYVDLYLIHWPSNTIPLAETFRGLNEIAAEGKVRTLGVSNFDLKQLQQAQARRLPLRDCQTP